ncbi:hypothetical protein CISIN_1g035335mg [Citrus sinensis]|uniref:Uncharacterized protein n=1 Tax=Citrus sinensis TaxID=2711 RepID=A0A067H8N8_CITSI|nr:hypothetical protein CISIN_1g035335mg [Citrus sinensis]
MCFSLKKMLLNFFGKERGYLVMICRRLSPRKLRSLALHKYCMQIINLQFLKSLALSYFLLLLIKKKN